MSSSVVSKETISKAKQITATEGLQCFFLNREFTASFLFMYTIPQPLRLQREILFLSTAPFTSGSPFFSLTCFHIISVFTKLSYNTNFCSYSNILKRHMIFCFPRPAQIQVIPIPVTTNTEENTCSQEPQEKNPQGA